MTLCRHIRIVLGTASFLLGSTTSAQSPTSPMSKPPMFPASGAPVPMPAPDMQAVLDAQASLKPKPIENLTPAVARMQPSPTDGVMQVMTMKGMPTAPDPAVTAKPMAYGSDPKQTALIYKPVAAKGNGPLPLIVYYHGGGWVIADLKTYDATPRFLSKQLNAIVVSVEYRHAPEAKFPAQHDDANMAYAWAAKNAAAWGGDPMHIALAGESAGGNLAVATAIHTRDAGMPMPVAILAIYPIANSDPMTESKIKYTNAKPLNGAMLKWFNYYVFKSMADTKDTRVDLVHADLHGLPPVTIINAELDPLQSDGVTLAAALRSAGVSVEQRTFPGVTHEFFGMGKVVKGAYDAEGYAVERLKSPLGVR